LWEINDAVDHLKHHRLFPRENVKYLGMVMEEKFLAEAKIIPKGTKVRYGKIR
jgi:hypothetical protein